MAKVPSHDEVASSVMSSIPVATPVEEGETLTTPAHVGGESGGVSEEEDPHLDWAK